MKGGIKFFLSALMLSIFFFLGLNVLSLRADDLFVKSRIINNFDELTASVSQQNIAIPPKPVFDPEIQPNYDLTIDADSAISIEINEKGEARILFAKNPEKMLPIASIAKLMTAFVILNLDETYKPVDLITINKEAVDQEGSSKFGDLRPGEKLSVYTLLNIALIESSNDAAYALTEPIGEEGFAEIMNLYAKDMGMGNTFFINATGLEPDIKSDPINYSTAEDLVKLARAIMERYPEIFQITSQNSYTALKPDGQVHHFIPENTNVLLSRIPEIIGGKTGLSPRAKGCLLSVVKNPRNEKSFFINVVLGADDRFGDMKKLIKEVDKIKILGE